MEDKTLRRYFSGDKFTPKTVFTIGDKRLLDVKDKICIVGSRRVDEYAKYVLKNIFEILGCMKDIVVISGLALGTDSLVHQYCFNKSIPTIAITPGGIGRGFPISNQKIFDQIAEHGLIISEYPSDSPIVKGSFPHRNRLMVGLADIGFVIRAGAKSGSLITGNLFLESGKELYVPPGRIGDRLSEGTNKMIVSGANMIDDFGELASMLGIKDLEKSLRDQKLIKVKSKLDNSSDVRIADDGELIIDVKKYYTVLTELELDCIVTRNYKGKYFINR